MIQRLSSDLVKHGVLPLSEFLNKSIPFIFPEQFGAVGDGVTDDTLAIRNWILACQNSSFIGMGTRGKTYAHYHIQIKDVSGVSLMGGGAVFKNIGGQTGEQLYASGAMICFIGNCQKIRISGIKLNGNRDGSPLYTGFNHGLQFVTGENDFRSNNGGDIKSMRDIIIHDCDFENMGSFRAGNDKFGDGIYFFGVDGLRVTHSRFKDMGRWGIAGSDCLNVEIEYNFCDNSKEGTVALGFIDIENESTDQTNGSWSRNIRIQHNRGIGHAQILVGGGNNDENDRGKWHFLRDVLVSENELILKGGAHANPDYTKNLIYIGCAPFITKTSTNIVENSNIRFTRNTVRCEWADNLSIGMGINAQVGKDSADNPANGNNMLIEGISFEYNYVIGLNKPYQFQGEIKSTGCTLRKVKAVGNVGKCVGTSSIGLRFAATQMVDYDIHSNDLSGYTLRGISLEDGRAIGAIDSVGVLGFNNLTAALGNDTAPGVFTSVYRVSFMGNTVHGGVVASIIANHIDKDYGNTWNTLSRIIPSTSIAVNSQVARGNIDLGSHVRFGYSVTPIAPSLFGQVIITGTVTDPGFGMVIIANLSADVAAISETAWPIVVEKR